MAADLPWERDFEPEAWAPPPPPMRWARWGSHEAGQGVHGFVEDRRIRPILGGRLAGLGVGRRWAVEPDYSVLGGMPEPVVRWQVYRARYAGELLRRQGLTVVPVLQWADPAHWSLMTWGIKPGSAVACRAPSADLAERAAWSSGYRVLVEAVMPSVVLVFGVASRVRGTLDAVGLPWQQLPLRSTRTAEAEGGKVQRL